MKQLPEEKELQLRLIKAGLEGKYRNDSVEALRTAYHWNWKLLSSMEFVDLLLEGKRNWIQYRKMQNS